MVKFQPSKLAMRVRFPLPASFPMKMGFLGLSKAKSQNTKSDIVQGKGIPRGRARHQTSFVGNGRVNRAAEGSERFSGLLPRRAVLRLFRLFSLEKYLTSCIAIGSRCAEAYQCKRSDRTLTCNRSSLVKAMNHRDEIGRRARLRIAKSSISERRSPFQFTAGLREKKRAFREVSPICEWRVENGSF
jgi:hypothetical protein